MVKPIGGRVCVTPLANAQFINPYRKRRLHFQNEMIFVKIDKAFVAHFA